MRLTAVQRDVIDRLKDGWYISGYGPPWLIRKMGEASRHVKSNTFEFLRRQGLIARELVPPWRWFLVDGADV